MNIAGELKIAMHLIATTNDDVIEMFMSDSFPKDKMPTWGTTNLKITRTNGNWSLVNYQTPLVVRHDGKHFFNSKKYSTSTTQIQNKIKSIAKGKGIDLTEASEDVLRDPSKHTEKKEEPKSDKKIIEQKERGEIPSKGKCDKCGEKKRRLVSPSTGKTDFFCPNCYEDGDDKTKSDGRQVSEREKPWTRGEWEAYKKEHPDTKLIPKFAAAELVKTAAPRVVVVEWDDNNEASIAKAEKQKSRLENSGYTLTNTVPGLFRHKLVYQKKASKTAAPRTAVASELVKIAKELMAAKKLTGEAIYDEYMKLYPKENPFSEEQKERFGNEEKHAAWAKKAKEDVTDIFQRRATMIEKAVQNDDLAAFSDTVATNNLSYLAKVTKAMMKALDIKSAKNKADLFEKFKVAMA